MNNQDLAREEAKRAHDRNEGWAQTHTWDASIRNAYESERTRLQHQQQEEAIKRSGR